ncbi:hypothetical protein [Nocardioides sp. CER19]|uniref:hypothetical protein n=1 Tax=Nocardioides sp. CER19 TaxID=3038538 RepID=UPI0024493ABE|nr:hypothetical protein [Nocardioides sp. CER19]MDH2413571.1 hypothetical protein [Nocardioides sp. CER19]
MTEEFLVLGRPPRPPRRGRWVGRGPRIALAVIILGLVVWAVWRGVTHDPAAKPSPPAPTSTQTGSIAHEPPAVPYLRSGTLIPPAEQARGIPDGSWTDFATLADGRVVLVQRASLTVLGTTGQQRSFEHTSGLTARPDGTGAAWTGRDGRVRRLDSGHPDPVVVRGARQLTPACRGLRAGGRVLPGWQTCDRDGGLLSPDGRYFASIGGQSVTLAPRDDITGGTSTAFLGTVRDAVWEDAAHLLVVMDIGDEAHLMRVSTLGRSEDLIAPVRGASGRARPVLVLPMTSISGAVQP